MYAWVSEAEANQLFRDGLPTTWERAHMRSAHSEEQKCSVDCVILKESDSSSGLPSRHQFWTHQLCNCKSALSPSLLHHTHAHTHTHTLRPILDDLCSNNTSYHLLCDGKNKVLEISDDTDVLNIFNLISGNQVIYLFYP